MSNIAYYASNMLDQNQMIDADKYTKTSDLKSFINGVGNTKGWEVVLKKFDSFAKYDRKDCIFLADGLKDVCLDGDEKFIRRTNSINTLKNTVMNRFMYMSNVLNSSYSAGYCNWFY